MEYLVSDYFQVPTKTGPGGEIIPGYSNAELKEFWEKVDENSYQEFNITSAVGCYIYANHTGDYLVPWYVGKASQGFKVDMFKKGDKGKYTEFMEMSKGMKSLVFIIAVTSDNKAAKSVDKTELDWVENYLIQMAYKTNHLLLNTQKPDHLNTQKPDHLRGVSIPGVLNANAHANAKRGGRTICATFLRKTLKGLMVTS